MTTETSLTQSDAGPFAVLADFEQRSLNHVAGAPEEADNEDLWRGIGFRLGERRMLSGIDEVTELLVMPPLTAVPGTQTWMLGIANVRGNLVPIVDLHQYLYGERTQTSNRSRVLRVGKGAAVVGLLVAEVLGQRTLNEEDRNRDAAGKEGEDDERLVRFVVGKTSLDGQEWSMFSMTNLVEASDFQHAAV